MNWKLANSAATVITVKRRVSGGAWTEIASLAGYATSLATDTVSIGRYNEYRIEVSDGTETVWAEKDFAVCPLLSKGTRTVMGCTPTSAYDYLAVDTAPGGFTATVEFAGASQSGLGLTPGEGKGNSVNLIVRKDINTLQTLALSRFVDVNILALYAHDDGIDKVYAQEVWTSYGNTTSTRFRIRKTGKTYQLGVVASDGAWADVAPYTFVGDDHIGNGSCLVGVSISDPNLATLSQIAPIELRTLIRRGMTVVFR